MATEPWLRQLRARHSLVTPHYQYTPQWHTAAQENSPKCVTGSYSLLPLRQRSFLVMTPFPLRALTRHPGPQWVQTQACLPRRASTQLIQSTGEAFSAYFSLASSPLPAFSSPLFLLSACPQHTVTPTYMHVCIPRWRLRHAAPSTWDTLARSPPNPPLRYLLTEGPLSRTPCLPLCPLAAPFLKSSWTPAHLRLFVHGQIFSPRHDQSQRGSEFGQPEPCPIICCFPGEALAWGIRRMLARL